MSNFDHVHLFYTRSFDNPSYFAHDLLEHIKVEKTSLNNTDNIYSNKQEWIDDLSGNICLAFMYNKINESVFPFFHTKCQKSIVTPIQQNNETTEDDYDENEVIPVEVLDHEETYFYFNIIFFLFLK